MVPLQPDSPVAGVPDQPGKAAGSCDDNDENLFTFIEGIKAQLSQESIR
jgi:hypothetical protein